MNSLYQLVIRNVPTRGYDVIHKSEHVDRVLDVDDVVSEFLANYILNSPHPYFVKYSQPESSYFTVGLVHPDGKDEHGRSVARVHLLFIDKRHYHQKALPYWISPLFHSVERLGTTILSLSKDFVTPRFPDFIPPRLVENILLRKSSFYYLNRSPRELNLLAAFIDKMVPVMFNERFSIISASNTVHLKKIPSLTFLVNDEAPFNLSSSLEDYFQPSSYALINMLCESARDEEIREELNERMKKGLFDSDEDRRVFELMKWRFSPKGIKTVIMYKYLEFLERMKIKKNGQ